MSDLTPIEEEINSRFITSYNTLKSLKRAGKKGDFCESLGLRREYFSRFERNELAVPEEAIKNLSKIYHISTDWLLQNRGDMFLAEAKAGNSQHNQVVGNIGNLAGRDVRQQNSSSDCEQQLAIALNEIEHLKARLADKEEIIQMLRSK